MIDLSAAATIRLTSDKVGLVIGEIVSVGSLRPPIHVALQRPLSPLVAGSFGVVRYKTPFCSGNASALR